MFSALNARPAPSSPHGGRRSFLTQEAVSSPHGGRPFLLTLVSPLPHTGTAAPSSFCQPMPHSTAPLTEIVNTLQSSKDRRRRTLSFMLNKRIIYYIQINWTHHYMVLSKMIVNIVQLLDVNTKQKESQCSHAQYQNIQCFNRYLCQIIRIQCQL